MKEKKDSKKPGCLISLLIGLIIILAVFLIIGLIAAPSTGTQKDEANTPQQSSQPSETIPEEEPAADASSNEPEDDNIPTEYKSALNKAKAYSDTMYMSKAAIYDQLISDYGEKFTKEEADYAIANLK